MRQRLRFLLCLTACLPAIGLVAAPPAHAADADRDIRLTLQNWTADFNARRADRVCDLFSRSLVAQFRGTAPRGYAEQCRLLQTSLAPGPKRFRYSLRIDEIIVSGDLAVVRLVWTLGVQIAGQPDAKPSDEVGMDIFRHEADGHWRIVRYIAFATD